MPLDAPIPPEVARFILEHFGSELVAWMTRFERMRTPGALWQAGEIRRGLQAMQSSVRLRNLIQAGMSSGDVSTEVPETPDSSGSVHPPSESGASTWVSVSEVATRAGVSDRFVSRLCRDQVLVATRSSKRGRPWQIDLESAAEYLESRSTR